MQESEKQQINDWLSDWLVEGEAGTGVTGCTGTADLVTPGRLRAQPERTSDVGTLMLTCDPSMIAW